MPGATDGELAGALIPDPAQAKASEKAWVANDGLEPELKSNVGQDVVVVVDLHLVENFGIEWKVVGSVAGLQEGIDVHHKRDAVRMIRS